MRPTACPTAAGTVLSRNRESSGGPGRAPGLPRKWRSPCGPRHSPSITTGCRSRSSAAQLHRSDLPLETVARVAKACAHPQRPHGRYEVPTNELPRNQPVRLELRSNQRLYVPFGSPPSVAVGFSSTRAAHASRALNIVDTKNNSIAAGVATARCAVLIEARG